MGTQDLAGWKCFLVVAGKGGIGKTLVAMLLAVALILRNRTPTILEADMQRRLPLLFPDLTTTIDIDQLDALADDPMALARAFSAIPKAVRDAAAKKSDVIVDTAATWHLAIIKYVAEIKLTAKVAKLGGKVVFLVPVTADTDAVLLAIETAEKIEQLVPMAELIFVLNAHPHSVMFDLPAVNAIHGADKVNRLLRNHRQVRLREMPQKIWGHFERHNMTVLDVISADANDLLEIACADPDTVELMQGRVAQWFNSFVAEMEPVMQFHND